MRYVVVVVMLVRFGTIAWSQPARPEAANTGVLPVGADGKPLNLDFETGTLKDWTAEGDAFKGQPIKGDTVHPRRSDSHSRHQGQFWLGGYERVQDKPQGTLTSVPFKVTHPWASFLVGGGPHVTTCVELVRADTGALFYRATGLEAEDLRRVVVDLKELLGKEMFVRVVDRHSGHWGHVNFDDFRFHAEKPDFPPPPGVVGPDVLKFAGLTPDKAAAAMTVPEGFDVKRFAGEPDVVQPIAMCLDDRGRVWVAEAYAYPIRRSDKEARDRILIFEDTDGDGKHDKRTVFMEGLNLVSGLEVGFGGVWIGAAPYLMHVPMKDDRPAGEPKILLDGWAWQDTHETLNSFIWGPDGWLYGCHGVFTHSRVGKPGTPDDQRVPINAGVWRYHPTKHVFEVFAHGTSNPWGLDFNDQGQAFVEACVIPHCFHIIQGARYHRQAGQHFNPYTFDDIKTIADHFHYVGPNPHGGNNRSDTAGGGHAHCGLMCYLGGTWPKEYRGQLFMGNVHGRRLNVDVPRGKGSGYVAGHSPDFLLANDAWARFINLRYGPDGNVYLIDWYDKQACHHTNPNIWDRTNGRIFKISHRNAPAVQVDLAKKSSVELAELQTHDNDWYVRHARRLLQERQIVPPLVVPPLQDGGSNTVLIGERPLEEQRARPQVRKVLQKIALEHEDPRRRLRGLWALHAVGEFDFEVMDKALQDKDEYVRGWAIQLAVEKEGTELLRPDRMVELATNDPSPVVRRYLASALLRTTFDVRERVLEALLGHDDAADPNLPLLYWYALEPLGSVNEHRKKALVLAENSSIPFHYAYMVRRVMEGNPDRGLEILRHYLGQKEERDLVILRELSNASKGRGRLPQLREWDGLLATYMKSKNSELRQHAISLAALSGNKEAFASLRAITAGSGDIEARRQALTTLIGAGDPEMPPLLHKLLDDPAMRGAALRGLANFDDPKAPGIILGTYSKLTSDEKRDAVSTLTSRPSYARALLDALAAKRIPAAEVSADAVRNLRNFGDKELTKRVAEVWGVVRNTPKDRAILITQYHKLLKTASPQGPDLALGRAIYAKTCASCHTLFGTGGKVGPDITGANRADLGYLLENVLDPSAVIQKEYAATVLELHSGRVVTGIVKAETPAALTVVTATETLTIPRDDVAGRQPTNTSMMPDDQLKPFSQHEVRSLFAYLQSPRQVPLLATPENAKDFFNGKDLTGWDGDPALWRVEDGEIVGRSPGIKHNSFLRSQLVAADFKLTLKVKLTPNKENSGVQFRSEVLKDGDVKGYQADVGAGWWGKLYEEHGRGLLWKEPGEQHVNRDGWNTYEIVARGSRIQTFLNGQKCVDLDDPEGSRRGIFALQIHSGGPMEVRFKDLRLEVLK